MKEDRRKGERRSYPSTGNNRLNSATHQFPERRKTIIRAGRRTGLVGEYYNPSDLIWHVKNLREKGK